MMFLRHLHSYSRNARYSLMALSFTLILFGILLLIMPELLAYIISFLFILLGVTALTFSWRIRHTEKNVQKRVEQVADAIQDRTRDVRDTFDRF